MWGWPQHYPSHYYTNYSDKGAVLDKGKDEGMRNKVQYEAKAESNGIQQ